MSSSRKERSEELYSVAVYKEGNARFSTRKWCLFLSAEERYLRLPSTVSSVRYTLPDGRKVTAHEPPFLIEGTSDSQTIKVTVDVRFKISRADKSVERAVDFGRMKAWSSLNISTGELTQCTMPEDMETFDGIVESERRNNGSRIGANAAGVGGGWPRKDRLQGFRHGWAQLKGILLSHFNLDTSLVILEYAVPRKFVVPKNAHAVLNGLHNVGVVVEGAGEGEVSILNCRNCTVVFAQGARRCTIKNCSKTQVQASEFCGDFFMDGSESVYLNFPKAVPHLTSVHIKTQSVHRSMLTAFDARNPTSQASKGAHNSEEELHIWNGRGWEELLSVDDIFGF